QGRVKPLQDKVAAIKNYEALSTVRQMRGFLGLASYYRRFIPRFAEIANPLVETTKGRKAFRVEWNTERRKAFEDLKQALCQEAVLHTPNFNIPFTLQTDASAHALGAVLAQEVDGIERPVAFASRKLNEHEKRVQTYDCGERIADWFSEFLGRQCHLIRQSSDFKGNATQKHVKGQAPSATLSLSLVNEAQYLLINTASILYLKEQIIARLEEPLETEQLIQRFRANIVINTVEPFEEEEWAEISIGALHFQVVGPCNRCQIICIDQQSGERNKEFLQSLSNVRGRKTHFGIYLMNQSSCSSSSNLLSVGSPVFPILKESTKIQCPPSNEEKASG
ncbi:PREDICTED: molybdenum cofactor sulfurase-like, partial [Gavialis gangeticus]|uniref:molybdenum cofactor sulfurase-like n=1 Tax=Gavialis gangeticus TaxID=94835 RepID=UPI00092E6F3E